MANDEKTFLIIPQDYAVRLDGLQWSSDGEAIVTRTGETFAFAPQIWQFLEGLISVRPPIHFAHVLHWLHLLGVGPISKIESGTADLRGAFLSAGRPLRNAGILCAQLTRDLPGTVRSLDTIRLRQQLLHHEIAVGAVGDMPPLSFGEFQNHVLKGLLDLSHADLLHWFKFGKAPGPKSSGESLAQAIERRPMDLLDHLARAARVSERLAGALALAPALNGALTLPPRRLDASHLPIGGYADVTTRGEPERLLPSQFALESDDFVRRFAEHELLYFRREEPADPTREELIVLLDQGVRTWGGPRLALSGAVLAFAHMAGRRRVGFRMASTSTSGASLDPLAMEIDELTALLEASDLTARPDVALLALLEETAERQRDIVVLTHPRSLIDERFIETAATVGAEHRLFAVSVDSEGRGRLDQLRDGRALALARFRVDLAAAENVSRRGALIPTDADAWSGDVEPVPFPFWFGPVKNVQRIAFDWAAKWLLVATSQGLLHLMSLVDHRREVLPRGFFQGQVLRDVEAILGVHDGFVVCGRTGFYAEGERYPRTVLLALHYDLAHRCVRAHLFPVDSSARDVQWFSFPEFQCIGCRANGVDYAIELQTGLRTPAPPRTEVVPELMKHMSVPSPHVVSYPMQQTIEPYYRFDGLTGSFGFHIDSVHGATAIPETDGRSTLRGAKILDVQCTLNTLGILYEQPNEPKRRLLLLRDHDCSVVREIVGIGGESEFQLAADGRAVAIPTGQQEVSVYETAGGGKAAYVMSPGRHHNNVQIELGVDWMRVLIGHFVHQFRWDGAALEYAAGVPQSNPDAPTLEVPTELGPLTRYDPGRFLIRVKSRLRVEVDRFGHVLALDARGERLIAIFWFRREKAAGWLPDGARWGDPSIAGLNSPNAASRFARALRQE